jgi:hypothetical protein
MNTPVQSYQPSSAVPFILHLGTQPPQPLPRGFSSLQPTHAPLSEQRGGQSLSLISGGLVTSSLPDVVVAVAAALVSPAAVGDDGAPVPAAGGVEVAGADGEQATQQRIAAPTSTGEKQDEARRMGGKSRAFAAGSTPWKVRPPSGRFRYAGANGRTPEAEG